MINRTRILGLILVVAGIILEFTYENDGKDFITGFLIGGGLALFFSRQIKNKKE